jgi:PRTRC genetic system protein B
MPNATLHLHLQDAANLRLEQAILIYRSHGARDACTFASIHPIGLEHGTPSIQAGKPVTSRAVRRLAASLTPGPTDAGFLPGNVLYTDGDSLAWWVPPQRRHIAFRSTDACLGERGAVVPHPGLIFMVSGGQWLVWAHKGRKRPTPESPMWRAPYFNVGADGSICRGNVVTPTGAVVDKIAAWEDAFFRSYFTHPNVSHGLIQHPSGAYAFWAEMIDAPPSSFPQRMLVATGTRLKDLLDRYAHSPR